MGSIRRRLTSAMFFLLFLMLGSFCMALLMGPDRSQAQAIGPDKYKHAAVSAGLGLAAAAQIADPWRAWGVAMLPGLAKEVYDSRKGGTGFSLPDMAANAIGAYVGVKVAGLIITPRRIVYVEPALPRYYTPEACSDISAAYLECAEKYGWTWHKSIATGPELKLGAAIVVPAFMVYQERTARLQAEADAARARQLAARGGPPGAHQAAQATVSNGS